MDTDPHEAHAALERHKRDIVTLRAASTAADEALRSAPDDELPQRLADRDRARAALTEAQGRTAGLEAAVARADAARAAEEQHEAEAVAEAAQRAKEAEARAAHEAEIAPLLAALARVEREADDANANAATAEATRAPISADELVRQVLVVMRTDTTRRAHTAHLRARVAAEIVEAYAAGVEEIEPRHPAAVAGRSRVTAMKVHAELADLDDARALFRAARVLEAAARSRIANPASPIARAVLSLDAARTDGERSIALEIAAGTATVPRHVTRAEIGRLAIEGRAHEIHALAAERERTAELAARCTAVESARDLVAQGKAAVRELAYSRASGHWNGDEATRTETLREIIAAAGVFLARQVAAQIATRAQVFTVALTPGGPPTVKLDQGITGNGQNSDFSAPIAPRAQLQRFLGIEGTPEADIVPDPTRVLVPPSVDPMVGLARGTDPRHAPGPEAA